MNILSVKSTELKEKEREEKIHVMKETVKITSVEVDSVVHLGL